MQVLLGVLVATFALAVVLGGLTGKLRLGSCCSIADPRHDKRMAEAFDDEPTRLP